MTRIIKLFYNAIRSLPYNKAFDYVHFQILLKLTRETTKASSHLTAPSSEGYAEESPGAWERVLIPLHHGYRHENCSGISRMRCHERIRVRGRWEELEVGWIVLNISPLLSYFGKKRRK